MSWLVAGAWPGALVPVLLLLAAAVPGALPARVKVFPDQPVGVLIGATLPRECAWAK